MKRQIFLYLFLFAVLLLIFQYMNEKSIFESQEKQIEGLSSKLENATKARDSLTTKLDELDYFTLQGNDNAMTYFESMGYEANEIEAYISDRIYDKNLQSGSNPLVPFEGQTGGMKINKIKFLNHKWILADFTDGTYWGELLLQYTLDQNGDIHFENLSSFIYPR
ncbi:MAG TPA: hypothetical protein VFF21_01995 [Flavobacteriaceae bacterium]|nr:hypothetical protein [Flavobacteriaceae bacterium]